MSTSRSAHPKDFEALSLRQIVVVVAILTPRALQMTDLTVRIDKWLWAARFFKTRSMAADAVSGGKVELNGDRVKRAKSVKIGDELKIRLGFYEHVIAVRALSERRGPAAVAQALYEETPESAAARAKLAERMRYEMPKDVDSGRPSKKDRRDIRKFRER